MNPRTPKLYSQQAILGGAFLFCPAAVYFLAHNFTVLGRPRRAKITVLIGVIVIIATIATVVSLAEYGIQLPQYVIPAALLGLAAAIYTTFQKPLMTNSHAFYRWRPAVIIICGTLLLGALYLGFIKYLADQNGIRFEDALSMTSSQARRATQDYETMRTTIVENDTAALSSFNAARSTGRDNYLAVLDRCLSLYQTNKHTLEMFGTATSLPQLYQKELEKLTKYTDLRIEMFRLLKKEETEQSNTANSRLDEIAAQINNLSTR